jgi:D-beta-D-heptose 7-phosphate kinase/D-beta-D-heptose 1-phosphate adenosyltransferase
LLIRAQAEAVFSRFAGLRVLVVGDLMADEYIRGSASRVSPEAPVLVLDAVEETFVPGGAANVAEQILAFGASVSVAGVVGNDVTGERLRQRLTQTGANVQAVVVSSDRPTTQKTRIVAGNQQIVRVDREKRGQLPASIARQLLEVAEEQLRNCDAVLLSDYDKGVLTPNTIKHLIARAGETGKVTTANPKPASIKHYAGATVVQLNHIEADLASRSHNFDHSDEATFHQAGTRLRQTLGVHNLLVTRRELGLTLFQEPGDYFDIPAHRVDVFDGTGAGDSTIAGYTLALAAKASLREAIEIGNASGGAVVRKAGVVTATPQEVVALFGA